MLSQLLKYDSIIVQCHDNPDADAIASGYALYYFFKENGKDVRFIYSGRNKITKANLKLLIEYLEISKVLEYMPQVSDFPMDFSGLLVTVDCQYGAGNVTKFPAKNVAIIDHHQVEIKDVKLSLIMSELGSCSTVVWKLMKDEGLEIEDSKLATALYFGLFSDTNSMSEVFNPYDKDMRDELLYDRAVISVLKNSNFSLDEFEIASKAMSGCKYDEKHRFAYIKTEQCDPNILGLISDFLLQVAEVECCVVYNEWDAGYKFSVRSCVKEVRADDMAAFLAEGIGSGGGHLQKAGGFIKRALFTTQFQDMLFGDFIQMRMEEYFKSYLVIKASEYEIDTSDMKEYVKKSIPRGFVLAKDVLPVGTPVIIRTLEGDADMIIEEDSVIMIGIKGEVYPTSYDKLVSSYEITDSKYSEDGRISKPVYLPTIHNQLDGSVIELAKYAHVCISGQGAHIYAKPAGTRVKVFTQWNNESYFAGAEDDYLAVRCDDLHDIYVVEKEIFAETYEQV